MARRQLFAAGLSKRQVDARIAAGRLRRVHQGVYAVAGAPATREALWMAAVLTAGPGAALSHRSAAELWGLLPGCASPLHVTVPSASGRARRPALVIHRAGVEVVRHRGTPVTTPQRTLRDLKAGRVTFERAVSEAQRLRLISQGEADRLLPSGKPPANRFERLFLGICKEHGIPKPTRQAKIGPYTVGFLWPRSSSSSRQTATRRTARAQHSKRTESGMQSSRHELPGPALHLAPAH